MAFIKVIEPTQVIGVLVSRLNGCSYCASHHAEGLKRLLIAESVDFGAYILSLERNEPGDRLLCLCQPHGIRVGG